MIKVLKRLVIGGILGAIPGIVLVALTVPISGEVELSLGVLGIFIGAVGFLIGATFSLRTKT